MINETISNLTTQKALDFNSWTAVTQNNIFLLCILGVWLLPLIIAIILASCIGGGTGASKKKMINFGNFWLLWFLWFFLQAGLILILIIFPIWLSGMGG
jgi:hypothetical protein